MTDQQKNTQDNPRTPWEGMPFTGMMQKMMGQQGEGCGCSDMMGQQGEGCGCSGMMSQMTTMFSETQEQGGTEKVVEEATQEA